MKTDTALRVATYALTFALGGAALAMYSLADANAEMAFRIAKLEADVRTESGKRLNLEETVEEAKEAAFNAGTMQVWDSVGLELEACRKNKP